MEGSDDQIFKDVHFKMVKMINARKENMSAEIFFLSAPQLGEQPGGTERQSSTKVKDWSEAFPHLLNAHGMQECLKEMSLRCLKADHTQINTRDNKYKHCKVTACVEKTHARSVKYSACPLAVRQQS